MYTLNLQKQFKKLRKKCNKRKRKILKSIRQKLEGRYSLNNPHAVSQLTLSYILLKKFENVDVEERVNKSLYADVVVRDDGILIFEIEGLPYSEHVYVPVKKPHYVKSGIKFSKVEYECWRRLSPEELVKLRIAGKERYSLYADEFYLVYYPKRKQKNDFEFCRERVEPAKDFIDFFMEAPPKRDKKKGKEIFDFFKSVYSNYDISLEDYTLKTHLEKVYVLDNWNVLLEELFTKE